MPQFPEEIYTPREMVNLPGLVRDEADTKNLYAEDYNEVTAEITAIEETLGLEPQGIYATVKEWLLGLASDDADIISSLSDYAKLTGRSGGQTLQGGTAASENLILKSTAHATKGKILLGNSAYDEVNNRLGIGTTSPVERFHVGGSFPHLQVGGTVTVLGVSQTGFALSNDTEKMFAGVQTGLGFFGTVSNTIFGIVTQNSTKVYVLADGKVGIGIISPTALLDVNSDVLRLRTAKTPASATATGNAGDICWDANYLYICIATNTWRRIAHATW